MRKKFVNVCDYVLTPEMKAPGGGEYITQPDQSMSIKEILQRTIAGFPPAVQKEGVFDSDPDLDGADLEKVAQMELEDRDQFARENFERIQANQAKVKEAEQADKAIRDAEAQEEREMKEEFRRARNSKKKGGDDIPPVI